MRITTCRRLASCLLLSAAFFGPVQAADSYPARPIRLLVPYAIGGNADIMARLVGQRLGEQLGQQIVIDNRPGAAGMIATELAARAVPDGYTMLIISSSHAVNPSLIRKLPYHSVKDFSPISLVGSTPLLVVVHPSLPAGSIKELIALAKARPGQINFGSNGNGSPANLAGALLNLMAGINLVHVAYKGTAQATNDVLAGHIPLGFPSMTSVLPHVKAGKLRALAITSPQRSALVPELATVAESGVPGYQAGIWVGLLLPAAAPRNIVGRLNAELGKVLSSTETRERFAGMGAEVFYSSPADFDAFMKSEIAKWARVIKQAGIRVDLAR